MSTIKINSLKLVGLFFAASVILGACQKERSNTTGWNTNDPKNGGFEVAAWEGQETGPGLVFVEGGTFTMGRVEQDVRYDWDNMPRRTTVSSFYMDETEVTNVDYREYLYWITRVFYASYPEVYKRALPDTLVWRSKLGFNEPYVELYLRHPAYNYYPVVGVNWLQATDYCAWRTDRVNEHILIREGILRTNPNQVDEDNFNTDAYLSGQYEGLVRSDLIDLDPNKDTRKVRIEDGILLPRYRLPTEAEWEFAALGLVGNTVFERVTERRLYPWNGAYMRNADDQFKGEMMANFKRGKGDNMGAAGYLNDRANIPTDVASYWPNDYGLYCMAGNVNEWVKDVYRPLSMEDDDDFNMFRGNVFKTQLREEEGEIAEKDSLGRIIWRDVTEEENTQRRNYKKADNINFLDGDYSSSIFYTQDEYNTGGDKEKKRMYEWGATSLINDEAHVYKGGSWKDRAYWLVPGTRRFLDATQSTDDIGFRCAMHRVGTQTQ
ncbi:MAG: SUMF1/EgtB/PvdO family nonheme iron enzyme [Flavobacteriales bacterium]|nr:SUMF1/EgtB/PvdO family nonheme iron enzyme [Flavobacteriales bacterium]MCB9190764.1 SUMF1/EgtB/PvdO family nonheme iron enzyme [Flavobacteriales bacterium]MCB9205294.1 SUMF1/EgtB/PvdO family nonheme iron enzyme [Flavobacteriales bacterium]